MIILVAQMYMLSNNIISSGFDLTYSLLRFSYKFLLLATSLSKYFLNNSFFSKVPKLFIYHLNREDEVKKEESLYTLFHPIHIYTLCTHSSIC